MKTVLKHEQHHKGRQSLEYTAIFEITPVLSTVKVRVELCRDSYDFQSYGRIQIFSPDENKWNFLASIPYSKLAILGDSYYANKPKCYEGELEKSLREIDVKNLLSQAEVILK